MADFRGGSLHVALPRDEAVPDHLSDVFLLGASVWPWCCQLELVLVCRLILPHRHLLLFLRSVSDIYLLRIASNRSSLYLL